jgi:hypothetical protein
MNRRELFLGLGAAALAGPALARSMTRPVVVGLDLAGPDSFDGWVLASVRDHGYWVFEHVQTRSYQAEEIARYFDVPRHLTESLVTDRDAVRLAG